MPIETAIIQSTVRTTVGTQDFTKAGFGDPDLVLAYMGYIWDDITSFSYFSFGAADGVNQFSTGIQLSGSSPSSTQHDNGILRFGGSTAWAEATFSSFITDGVRFNWTKASDQPNHITVILVKGLKNVKLGWMDLGAGSGTVNVTDVGFKPSLLINACAHVIGRNSYNNNEGMSYGFVHNSSIDAITQASCNKYPENNQSSLHELGLCLPWGAGSSFISCDFKNFNASGFDCDVTNNAYNVEMAYVAIELDDPDEINVSIIDTPLSTGVTATYPVGFEPASLLILPSDIPLVNTYYPSSHGYPVGWGSIDANEDNSIFACNLNSTASQNSVISPDNNANTDTEATLSSFESTGFTLNFSTVDAAQAKKWIVLALRSPAVATPKSNPLLFGQDF